METLDIQQDSLDGRAGRNSVPVQEFMYSGHNACPGCGAALSMRYVLKGLGSNTVIAITASCWGAIAGPLSFTSLGVPTYHCIFGSAASTASGIRAGLDAQGQFDTTVLAWAGDGGTFDIGLQPLSGAAERNENLLYVCYDNEAYMNTGIQRSSATPVGAWTMNTPAQRPEEHPKKNMVEIVASHRVPYTATASIAFPEDLIRKAQKAKSIKGFKFIHIISPCPPGWKTSGSETIKLGRLAVDTKVFPLYEIENGIRYTINYMPKGVPVKDYLSFQGRFGHLGEEDVAAIQGNVDLEWERLLARARAYDQ